MDYAALRSTSTFTAESCPFTIVTAGLLTSLVTGMSTGRSVFLRGGDWLESVMANPIKSNSKANVGTQAAG
jgi:hypothetical protein